MSQQKITILEGLMAKVDELQFKDSAGLKTLKLELKTNIKKIMNQDDVEEHITGVDNAQFYLMVYSNHTPKSREISQWDSGKRELKGVLDVLIEMLKLDEQLSEASHESQKKSSELPNSNKIFIVHGHDEVMKLTVKDTLRKLELEPIILHDQLDQGNTIIEKFEREASNVEYAIILLSPDDVGKAIKEEFYHPRARQNVILELGYFTGKLGRKRTFNLVKSVQEELLELPNDMSGVIYHSFDSSGGWQLKLCQSLKAAGYDVDLNMLF